ncbi:helix-turn-helix domain-containing protein [Sporosarcina limicola]|uniref:Transcriptional regulator with XRE-family HTH domain n=1 Tax=Sporosarcina limicola TaxID=34101 RepID=A0A927MPN4_9BACL|nr:helix-turn-helix domain-containing protein [Sporosarcina limicola]MBE1555249.1 transcriptional regulator with XRE-family HTH domain [Sporosarcina limicola]
MKHVGENIKRIRTAKKMTISDLANEHVSRGMISLIENGKTQPSIERLHHIAVQLDVDITELVEEISKEKLRSKINEAFELLNRHDVDDVLATISLLQPLLKKLDQSYEAARIYELYAKSLYHLYVYSNEAYLKIEENKWEQYVEKAIAIYVNLQMEWRVIKLWLFLANIEFRRANYRETIAIIDEGLDNLTIKDSLETKATYIELMFGKISTLISMGETLKAHELLDETIDFSRMNLVFINYYSLLNMKAWLYYDEQKYDEARKYVADATSFVQLVKKEDLFIEHEGTKILIEEFFEGNYENAIQLESEFERYLLNESTIQDSIKEEIMVFTRNVKARALTRLARYEEAQTLFKENQIVMNDFMEMAPLDVAIREISKSYEALCHFHLGDAAKAQQLARHVVDKLHKMPYSSFYHFAREVLADVMRG